MKRKQVCSKLQNYSGFTIIEMIVVVSVIAILAAAMTASYIGVTRQATITSLKSDLSNASETLKIFKANNGIYPTTIDCDQSDNSTNQCVKSSNGTTYQYSVGNSVSPPTFCITATSGNINYKIDQSSNSSIAGSCAGQGTNSATATANIELNPSVEANTSYLFGYFSSPIIQTSERAVSGNYSAKTTTNSTTYPQGIIWTITTNATPGQTYTCSAAVSGTPGLSVSISGRAGTSSDGYVGEGYGGNNVTLTNDWQRVSVTFTAPTNGVHIYTQYVFTTIATGSVLYVDAVTCTPGSTVYNFVDGNSSNWKWDGTTGLSTSSPSS